MLACTCFLALIILGAPSSAHAAFSYSGNLTGNPTYNRIFSYDVDPDCGATSTLSTSGANVPYQVIPIHTTNPAGENLTATVNSAGTDIADTTISLYCSFDPTAPQSNLVAYNDDADSSTYLSAFGDGDGVFMRYGRTYYFIITPFSPSAVGRAYQIDFGGGAAQTQAVPALSGWGVAALAGLLLAGALILVRTRRQA